MLGAADSPGGERDDALASRARDARVTVDQVVAAGGNFGHQNWAKEIRGADGLLIQIRGVSEAGDLGKLDALDGELFRASLDVGEHPRDVEDEDPVRVQLIAVDGRTWLELPVAFESDRLFACWSGSFHSAGSCPAAEADLSARGFPEHGGYHNVARGSPAQTEHGGITGMLDAVFRERLPGTLGEILARAKARRRTWACWVDSVHAWLFTCEMSLALSRERAPPVLKVDQHDDPAVLSESGTWTTDHYGR